MTMEKLPGQEMHNGDAEKRSEAARQLGSARTPAKIEAARAVAASRKGVQLTEEQKERQRQARWGDKVKDTGEPLPKRPRGRPRKTDAQSAMEPAKTPENGT